jgi:hypothetical protein
MEHTVGEAIANPICPNCGEPGTEQPPQIWIGLKDTTKVALAKVAPLSKSRSARE